MARNDAAILSEIENIAILVKQFSEASARWPNMEHHMIRWPIGSPQPDLTTPTKLGDTHYGTWTAVTRKEGILQFHAIAGGWFCKNGIQPRTDGSDPYFTLFTGRRWFGKGGRRDDRNLTADDIDAIDRFQTLSRHASILYSRISSDSSTRTAWIETLHELSTLPRVELPGYSPGYTIHSIADVFLESANVLVRLSQQADPPAPISVDMQAGTVTVNGVEHRDVNATTCRIVVELLEAKGCDVRWCDLEIRCGKRGMNRTRERDKVREIVGDYLKSGRNGFRLTF